MRSVLILLLTLCCAEFVMAAATPATTATTQAATTAPAELPDRSTPKAAAITLFKAISAGDRDVVAAGLFAVGDEQRALAGAMADMIVAGKKLGDAAQEKFGKAADPIGRGMLDPNDLEKLEDATVVETAPDAAVVTVPDQPRPMSFRKQDGEWKLVVTDFSGAAPANIAKQTRLVRAMAEATAVSANEVAAGKYKTPEEANFAIQQSLHQVMLSFYRPATTRAATQAAPNRGKP